MFFVAGISSKIKPKGVAESCICPACGMVSPLHVIHKYMTPHIFFIPTFPFHSEYVATCGNCASIMSIPPEKARAFIRNPGAGLDPRDLTVAQNNVRRVCGSCGGRLYHGQHFCGNCGAPV